MIIIYLNICCKDQSANLEPNLEPPVVYLYAYVQFCFLNKPSSQN